jgi:hypothetical protein
LLVILIFSAFLVFSLGCGSDSAGGFWKMRAALSANVSRVRERSSERAWRGAGEVVEEGAKGAGKIIEETGEVVGEGVEDARRR